MQPFEDLVECAPSGCQSAGRHRPGGSLRRRQWNRKAICADPRAAGRSRRRLTESRRTSPSQFRPAGPPALTSARYAQDFNEVKMLVGLGSTTRTAYQIETAKFWQFDLGIAQWDRVADTLLVQSHKNLLQTARVLALTDIAITDTVIALWDAKNVSNSWRPVTAIVNADLDSNPDTTADPTWLPL